MKLDWQKVSGTTEMSTRWVQWRTVQNGMRCSRSGRSYWLVDAGQDWAAERRGRAVKLELENQSIIDIGLPSEDPPEIERFLLYAFRCYRDSDDEIDSLDHIHKVCGSRLKKMICSCRFYEQTHPEYGSHFRGENPDACVALLVEMIVDAVSSKRIRIVGWSPEFDPHD
jgi:hypothetical protein